MATSSVVVIFARCVTNSATATAADHDVPDNCKEVIIQNRDSDDVLWRVGTAGATLIDDNTTGIIPGNGALTIAIGRTTERPNGSMNASGNQLVFQSNVIAATPRLVLTYVCESVGVPVGST